MRNSAQSDCHPVCPPPNGKFIIGILMINQWMIMDSKELQGIILYIRDLQGFTRDYNGQGSRLSQVAGGSPGELYRINS